MCRMCTDEDLDGNLFRMDCGCSCENITGEFGYCIDCQHYTGLIPKEKEAGF